MGRKKSFGRLFLTLLGPYRVIFEKQKKKKIKGH
jgi:hypothetical protein